MPPPAHGSALLTANRTDADRRIIAIPDPQIRKDEHAFLLCAPTIYSHSSRNECVKCRPQPVPARLQRPLRIKTVIPPGRPCFTCPPPFRPRCTPLPPARLRPLDPGAPEHALSPATAPRSAAFCPAAPLPSTAPGLCSPGTAQSDTRHVPLPPHNTCRHAIYLLLWFPVCLSAQSTRMGHISAFLGAPSPASGAQAALWKDYGKNSLIPPLSPGITLRNSDSCLLKWPIPFVHLESDRLRGIHNGRLRILLSNHIIGDADIRGPCPRVSHVLSSLPLLRVCTCRVASWCLVHCC